MARIAVQTTPEFDRDLEMLMRTRGIKNKSAAIRLAVHEAVQKLNERQDSERTRP